MTASMTSRRSRGTREDRGKSDREDSGLTYLHREESETRTLRDVYTAIATRSVIRAGRRPVYGASGNGSVFESSDAESRNTAETIMATSLDDKRYISSAKRGRFAHAHARQIADRHRNASKPWIKKLFGRIAIGEFGKSDWLRRVVTISWNEARDVPIFLTNSISHAHFSVQLARSHSFQLFFSYTLWIK